MRARGRGGWQVSETIKALVRGIVEAIFTIVTGPGTESEKAAKLTRAAEALASENAADAAIDQALKRT